MHQKGFIIDYRDLNIKLSQAKLRAQKQVTVPPHSEAIVGVKVPGYIQLVYRACVLWLTVSTI